jgi:multiple antibiotic resistance protein
MLRVADPVGERLGTTGLNIATRLLGLLLAAIAIETMADGLKVLFPGLTST